MHTTRWLAPENPKLDAAARYKYDNDSSRQPADWVSSPAPKPAVKKKVKSVQQSGAEKKKKKPKKPPKHVWQDLPIGKKVFFLIDCETTGSKRNWDRGIEYCVIAYDKQGKLLGTFVSRVSNDGVRIKPAAYAVHGISYRDLKDAPKFSEFGDRLNVIFEDILKDFDAGVLVAHNGATDFQFLCCDYQRAGLEIPKKINHTLCTLQCLRRFSALAYRKATPEQWTVLTQSGKPSVLMPAQRLPFPKGLLPAVSRFAVGNTTNQKLT